MRRSSAFRRQAGLTLIEVMISVAIGLVVVGAVTYLYVGSKGAYRGNESLAHIQETGRFALDAMTRDIRSAGALGCGSLESITTSQPVAPSVVAPAALGLVANPIQGYTPAPNYTPLPLTALPVNWAPPPPPAPTYWGGDVLQLQITRGLPVRMNAPVDSTNGNIAIADNTLPTTILGSPLPSFRPGDLAVVADCSSAVVFQVSAVASNASASAPHAALLSYVTGGAIPALPAISVTTFPTVQHFDQVTYYIGVVPNSVSAPLYPHGRTALYRYSMSTGAVEDVIDNVEDLDVVYGVDNTPNDNVVSADVFWHADLVTQNNAWPTVVSVRVSLIAAGDQLGVATGAQTFQLHGAGANLTPTTWTAPDTRLREMYTATAALRDRLN